MLVRLLVTALSLLIADYLIEGIRVEGFIAALIAGLVLGIVNTFIRPIFVVLTIPFTIVTFGLFILVINAILYYIVSIFVPGFEVSGFGAALLGSIVTSIISWLINGVIKDEKK